MKITFCGAAGEVTGSGYLVETAKATVLVDFGLFQGEGASDGKNGDIRPVDVKRLDAVVLTHAHLDHSGRLPILAHRDLRAPIHTTPASADFALLVLEDSGHIQEADAERFARKRAKAGKEPVPPLYTIADVQKVRPLFQTVEYEVSKGIAEGISIRMVDAGHILGSASVEMTVEENGSRRVVVFSGDVGPKNVPFLRDPVTLNRADLVVMETTYGDRDHRALAETLVEFHQILTEAVAAKRKILIPAFAIGRTQQILYYIGGMVREKKLPSIPIYLDSPMGIHATELYTKYHNLFDTEATQLYDALPGAQGSVTGGLTSLKFTLTADESRALNDMTGPMVIIAGSGMCEGGRIVHHLRNNLANPSTDVVMVGYQGAGTLGARLVSGAPEVSIFGEPVAVKAKVHTLGGFSAHAGRTELAEWIAPLLAVKPRVVLTHGDVEPRESFAALIKEKFGADSTRPMRFESVAL